MSNLGGYLTAVKTIKKTGGPKWFVALLVMLGVLILVVGVSLGSLF
ncbi:hypothetical protein FOB82_03750 [Corynebacterium xerosis]|uniref:Uncharacterized protein n=1 Tax=Corynebacterium xerosis TaxID=1725 RepID=A0A6B8TBF4_9CORY|nr:hypothetical protein [Corynebacterium xerosis]QGS34187.1 hypothetical protein FOB82_03750 [Corynebacterium xerosis]